MSGTAFDDLPTDSGIVTIQLAPGAVNLTFHHDPFSVPLPQVLFFVSRTEPSSSGRGAVVVEDAEGHTCTLVVDLRNVPPGPLDDFEICAHHGTRLEIGNASATPPVLVVQLEPVQPGRAGPAAGLRAVRPTRRS